MPTVGLPPPPINDAPGSFTWLEWYRQLREYVSTSGSVPWYIINFAGSNITDIATRLHNNLQGLQGGTTGEMYHLTAAQYSSLTSGPHNNLSGLQGGTTNEYYHLTLAQQSWVSTTSVSGVREILTSARTYYVRTDGNDSNNGLTNTAGGAFLTIQKAIDIVSGTLDLENFNVTIQVNDATRTESLVLKRFVSGDGQILIVGNSTTPSNCIISTTSANCITTNGYAGPYVINGFKFTTTTSGTALSITGLSSSVEFKNIDFGVCASSHINVAAGATCFATGNYTISGGAAWHYGSFSNGLITVAGLTITLTGTPAFSIAFCVAQTTGIVVANANSYSGSATGVRYNIILNAVVNTAGGGANYFPGNSAGTTATGGQYA